jgi:hypothetical protein
MISKFCNVVVLSFVLIARSASQESVDVHALTDSSRAIQFGIGSYLSAQAFDARSISYKFHLSSDRAIRMGIEVNGRTTHTHYDRQDFSEGSVIFESHGNYNSSNSVLANVVAQYLWYWGAVDNVYIFGGVGPDVGFGKYDYTSSKNNWNKATTWTFGAEGSLGAEWIFSRRFSLHAEYNYVTFFETRHTQDKSGNPEQSVIVEATDKSWVFGSGKVLFGLSVYL